MARTKDKQQHHQTTFRDTTAQQLFNQFDELDSVAPQERDSNCQGRISLLRHEIERRMDADDPEIWAIAGERLKADMERHESSLLPAEPKGTKELTPEHISTLTDSALQRAHKEWESRVTFELKQLRPVDWLERAVMLERKQHLSRVLKALANELLRRGLTPDIEMRGAPAKPVVRRPGAKVQPDVAKRRAIVARHPNEPAVRLCADFDDAKIPVNDNWKAAGIESWVQAHRTDARYRNRIDKMISEDKKLSK